MAKTARQLQRSASSYLDTREVCETAIDVLAEYKSDNRCTAPIRFALEASSNFEFVTEMITTVEIELEGSGLSRGLASTTLREVLTRPSLAMSLADAGLERIRQSVVIARNDVDIPLEIRLTVDAVIKPRTQALNQRVPPEVVSIEIAVELLDLESSKDEGRLLRDLIAWSREFPAPAKAQRARPRRMAFIGDPRRFGVEGAPDTWRQTLTTLAETFDLTADLKDGPGFDGKISSSALWVVLFDPYSGKTLDMAKNAQLITLYGRGRDFNSIIDEVTHHLLNSESEKSEAETAAVARDLDDGERVYHRKIGSSRNFDRFNEGSEKPCSHGEASFVPWSGPKATKGLARRYKNFHPSMHRHCKRFPDCGMYAVFA